MSLNPKQFEFCQHYLKTGNGTEAYMIAYQVEDSGQARANASRLLSYAIIQEYIESFQKAMEEKTGITIEQTVMRIAKLADTAKNEADRLKALDMLMKHLGGYKSDSGPSKAGITIHIDESTIKRDPA